MFIEAEQARLADRTQKAKEQVSDALRRLAEQRSLVEELERHSRSSGPALCLPATGREDDLRSKEARRSGTEACREAPNRLPEVPAYPTAEIGAAGQRQVLQSRRHFPSVTP